MPDHKFKYSDLSPLEQNPLQGKYHLLVVGTFNPARDNNPARWYYGRPENEFWCLLPRMMNQPSLHLVDRDESPDELANLWKKYCQHRRIVIIDIFKEVFVELPDYSDSHLQHLHPDQYTPFNFEQAFANAHFDGLLFTWKGQIPNRLTTLKQQYINFFQQKGTHIMHMLTPSMAYSKSRTFKLNQWKEQYTPIQHLL